MSGGDGPLLERVLRRVDAVTDGAPPPDTVPTGFPSVDALLGGGLRRGDLVALGGAVGCGKSAFALGVAVRAALGGHRAAVLTAERTPERLAERALCLEGRVRVDDVRTGALDDAARAAVGGAALRLRDAPLAFHGLAADGADAAADAVPRVPPPALVVVDALQALAAGRHAREEALAAAVGALKELARARDVAVLLVTQLLPTLPARPDPRPELADFPAAGAVAQQADVVLALHRERLYPTTPEAAELLVLKNRDGATGYADLLYYERWLRFEDTADPGA